MGAIWWWLPDFCLGSIRKGAIVGVGVVRCIAAIGLGVECIGILVCIGVWCVVVVGVVLICGRSELSLSRLLVRAGCLVGLPDIIVAFVWLDCGVGVIVRAIFNFGVLTGSVHFD